MLSLRCAFWGLAGLALFSLFCSATAATTDVVTPPTSAAGAQVTAATATAQSPTPIPGATPPASSGLPPQVAPGATPSGLPPGLTQTTVPGGSTTAPPANVVPPPVPQGTPLPEGSEAEKALEKSVVQIFTSYQEPNWSSPWIFDMPRRASGTGFLIDGNRIMTNAHVVAWTTQLVIPSTMTRDPISPRSSTSATT